MKELLLPTLHATSLSTNVALVTRTKFNSPKATHKFMSIFEGLSFLNFLK